MCSQILWSILSCVQTSNISSDKNNRFCARQVADKILTEGRNLLFLRMEQNCYRPNVHLVKIIGRLQCCLLRLQKL